MIIYIPTRTDRLDATVKARFLDPKNEHETQLFIKLNHMVGSNTAPNEEVLLSQPFIDLLKEHLPKKIKRISIDEGDFTQWFNETNDDDYTINRWLIGAVRRQPAPPRPADFLNDILNFFDNLPEQITELDLSQSILFTEPARVPRQTDQHQQTRYDNLKAIIKILEEKPLTYLALNHGDFATKGQDLNQWIKGHLPPTLHTIKLDNVKEERRIMEPSTYPENNPHRHPASSPLYFTNIVSTLDMSSPYPANQLLNVRDRTITKDNVFYFTNLFGRYMEADPNRAVQIELRPHKGLPRIYPNMIKTINLSRRNLHKWAIEMHRVPIAENAHDFITQLWRSIPQSVTKLILKGNKLASLSVENLEKFFIGFPEWVTVELSENGFNQLPFTELNDKLAVLPNTIIEFETEELYLRQDKKVIFVDGNRGEKLGFTPFHQIKYQKNIQQHELDALASRGMSEKDSQHLFAAVPCNSEFITRRGELMQLLVGPLEANSVTHSKKNAILLKARKRIDLFTEDNRNKYHSPLNTTLDLSYARLGWLSKAQLKELFSAIPTDVTRLILTHNGFAKEASMLENLAGAIETLKKSKISYIDFSSNEFYKRKYKDINSFLSKFIKEATLTMNLSISTDTPTTAYNHRCRIYWLDSYRDEANKHDKLLNFAHVLLSDYTMENSPSWALIYMIQWRYDHLNVVTDLNHEIAEGSASSTPTPPSNQLINSDDVLVQLNAHVETNPNGGFARRLAALSLFSEKMDPSQTARGREAAPRDDNSQRVLFAGHQQS
ncbi:MAG: hypothetical protein P1U36_07235 [Legionellaceae bacterium]|nr:hypothetical protein [Legionellaceae bacterium]